MPFNNNNEKKPNMSLNKLTQNPFVGHYVINKIERLQANNIKITETIEEKKTLEKKLKRTIAELKKKIKLKKEQEKKLMIADKQKANEISGHTVELHLLKNIYKRREKLCAEIKEKLNILKRQRSL